MLSGCTPFALVRSTPGVLQDSDFQEVLMTMEKPADSDSSDVANTHFAIR